MVQLETYDQGRQGTSRADCRPKKGIVEPGVFEHRFEHPVHHNQLQDSESPSLHRKNLQIIKCRRVTIGVCHSSLDSDVPKWANKLLTGKIIWVQSRTAIAIAFGALAHEYHNDSEYWVDPIRACLKLQQSITNGANEGIHMQTKTHKPMVGYHPQRLALLGPDLAAGRNFNLKLKVIWPALSSFRADVFTAYYHLHRVTVVQTRWLPHHESSLVAAGLALAFPRESSLRDWGLHSRNFSQIPCPQALVAFSCSVGTRITPLARDSF
ncbi:hypothetical protein P692DRAFT_20820819 [Suillus brevipes Sb2]|nr:hypothetical protein P692DRAFT_20820819 [Suillus brevipes Sb2]